MDLYRYFHPHHNPRLRNTCLRLQELAELEQAAAELNRAVRRAKIRGRNVPVGGIREEHFDELLSALDYIVTTLAALTSAHPGDSMETMLELLRERKDAPGWETWSRLLRQRLDLLNQYDNCSLSESEEANTSENGPVIVPGISEIPRSSGAK